MAGTQRHSDDDLRLRRSPPLIRPIHALTHPLNHARANRGGGIGQPMQPPGRRGPVQARRRRPPLLVVLQSALLLLLLLLLLLVVVASLALVDSRGGFGGSYGRRGSHRRLGVGGFVSSSSSSMPSRWPAAAAGTRHRRQGLAQCFVDRKEIEDKDKKQQQQQKHGRLNQPSEPPLLETSKEQRRRREAAGTSRREHVVTGGLLAGAMTATMLASRARAETAPMYMDRCVGWFRWGDDGIE
jgi:hypothetical protein